MEGRDVSNAGQGVLSPAWFAQWEFVIIRAMTDTGAVDAAFAQNWANAAGRTKRGAYGWPVPGGDNAALARQLALLAPNADFGYWADFENVGNRMASVAELETYVRALPSGWGGFYSNLSQLPRTPYLDSVPWWFANPSNNTPPRPVAITQYGTVDGVDANIALTVPFKPPPDPPSYKEPEMLLWQASDASGGLASGSIWLFNGEYRTPIGDPDEVNQLVASGVKLTPLLGQQIAKWPTTPPAAPVVLSDADVARIAAAIPAQHALQITGTLTGTASP